MPRRVRARRLWALAAAALGGAGRVVAQVDTYNGSGGNWTAGPWIGRAPQTGDTVFLRDPSPTPISITFDAASVSLNTLYVDGTNGAAVTLNQAVNGLAFNGGENVGYTGRGILSLSGGTQTMQGGNLTLGYNAGSAGTVNLSGAGKLNVTQALIVVGNNGSGTFSEIGGSINYTAGSGTMTLGVGATGVGVFNLSGGTVAGLSQITVGDGGIGTVNLNGTSLGIGGAILFGGTNLVAGSGTLNVSNGASLQAASLQSIHGQGIVNQTGGSVTLSGAAPMTFGQGGAGYGAYYLSAGTLTATNGAEVLGTGSGAGHFFQTGGTHTAAAVLIAAAGGFAGYDFNAGTLNLGTPGGAAGAVALSVGEGGIGTYTQSAGDALLNGDFRVGNAVGSTGTASLGGGTLTLASGTATIGNGGRGTFNQTDGNFRVSSGALVLGNAINSNGAFQLSGGTLTAGGVTIGNLGVGTFTQTGGSAFVTGVINVATVGGKFDAGTLNVSGSAFLRANSILSHGRGAVNQSGGFVFLNDVSLGLVVQGIGSSGYTLSGGTLSTLAVEQIGSGNDGLFTQTGGLNTPNWLVVGTGGANGVYNFSGGTLTSLGSTTSNVGQDAGSTGLFAQSGTASATFINVNAAAAAGSSGTIRVSGGTFDGTRGTLVVGDAGTGELDVTGGKVNEVLVQVGNSSGGAGTINVSGGAFIAVGAANSTSGGLLLGGGGSATFIQSGGTSTVSRALYVTNGSADASVNLSGGTLNVIPRQFPGGSTTLEIIGAAPAPGGAATFLQSGGLHTVAGDVHVGDTSAGTYNLTSLSGPSTFSVSGSMTIGVSAAGLFNQTGGTYSVGGDEIIGAGADGAFSQSGGTHAVAGTLWLTGTGASSLNLTTGAVSAANLQLANNGSLTVHSGTVAFTNVTQSGGTFSVPLTNKFNQPTGTATLTATTYALTGGTFAGPTVDPANPALANQFSFNGNFTQSGGVVTGLFVNNGTYTYQAGGFTGEMVNLGTLTLPQAGAFTAPQGLINAGSIALVSGQSLIANGIANSGFIGGVGTIGGSGGFTNAASVIQGDGNLTLANTGGMYNSGLIRLTAGRTLAVNATLTNVGNVVFNGGNAVLNAPLLNDGSLALGGGIVAGAATLTNDVTGFLTGSGNVTAPLVNLGTIVASGGVLNVPTLASNAGTILVNGLDASINGLGSAGLTNTGTIQGLGGVGLKVANAGTVEAVGGTLTVNGVLTNGANGLLRTSTGSKLLVASGLAVNSGTISLTGGTFDNGAKSLVNANQITGYGTFAAGTVTNAAGATITFAGGPATINAPIVNAAGATVRVNYVATVFTAPVTNNGTFQVTGGTATFAGGFTDNGLYVSDPSVNAFTDLTISPAGALAGGAGDRFTLTGNFRSGSAQPHSWDTTAATLAFTGGGASTAHAMDVNGSDGAGAADNFAWGTLELDAGHTLTLADGNAVPGGALYASVLDLAGAPTGASLPAYVASHLLNADASDPMNVYYDPAQQANAYLADASYALGNGGTLAPFTAAVPEPAGVAAVMLAGALFARRRRRQ